MSQFRGYTCDGCGNVIAEGHRTRYIEKFDGPVIRGEVVKDLCPVCVEKRKPEDLSGLRPLRRRQKAKTKEKVGEEKMAVGAGSSPIATAV